MSATGNGKGRYVLVPIITAVIVAGVSLATTYMTVVSSQRAQLSEKDEHIVERARQLEELEHRFKQLVSKLDGAISSKTYKMVGANGWTDTGIILEAGDIIEITASGAWSLWPERPDVCPPIGPEGTTAEQDKRAADILGVEDFSFLPPNPLPSAPGGALIGRVGTTGESFLVGANLTYQAESSGALYLGCNDSDANNSGSMVVEITKP
jgi:hypothetical protein